MHQVLPVREAPNASGEAIPPKAILIRPPAGWQFINFAELWRYRELLYFLVWRDVKVRYKQTVLGAAWAILQPLMMMVVFTIFFSRLAGVSSGDIPYPLFAYAGLLPWTFFATAISSAGNSVVGSERLITKIYFPRLAIPFGAVGASVVDFGVAFAMLLLLMTAYGIVPGASLLMVPLVVACIVLTAAGIGTLLAALNVAYRDFRYVIPFLVQLWMFATPSVYMQTSSERSGILNVLLNANPMTGLVATFRSAILGDAIPWGPFLFSAGCAVFCFFLGCLYFRKVEDSFVDII
jgi:lipopolysaccharide transport system permease protein